VNKPIVIVGEAFGEKEERQGRPFVGPSGKLLNSFLAAAGLSRGDCHLTNVFNLRPPRNDIRYLCGSKATSIPKMPKHNKGWIDKKYECEVERLYRELDAIKPNVIVALGGTATWALLHDTRITKLRGYQYLSVHGDYKVIPTLHPSAVLRQYTQRPVVFADFNKVRVEAEFPDIRRPERELWLEPELRDLGAFETYINAADFLTVDVETFDRQITCVGFAPSPNRAIVIPFVDYSKPGNSYWPSLTEELSAWDYVRRWLASPIPKVNQNISYDLRYSWEIYGMPMNNIRGDTMLRHHAMQPEMAGSDVDDGRIMSGRKKQGGRKSLGFLGSIYSYEPSWKSMRAEIKELKDA